MRRALIALGAAVAVMVAAFAFMPSREAFVQYFRLEPRATVLFAGDMLFDRSLREHAEQYGGDYLFECIDSTLQGYDLVVANLEGPITESKSLSVGSAPGSRYNTTFTFPTSTATLLKKHRIDVVSMGNNHIENFGTAGVESTKYWLDGAGVKYFGEPGVPTVAELDVRGIRLSFIGYNEFGGEASTTLAQIAAAKSKGRMPVVFAHWGIEYETTALPRVVVLAHQFVDAGAIAVIGSHPHVVQNNEAYKGVPVYYSLGNFIFDQYFSAEVMRGLLVELEFSPAGVVGVREIPTALSRDRRVCPVE